MNLSPRCRARRGALSTLTAAGVAVLATLAFAPPVAAQKVIAIQVYADPAGSGGEARYGVAPENEAVPVTPGERLRLTLIGSALIDGIGKEVRINASWSVASGDLQIAGRGDDWVDVVVGRGTSGVTGQIGYQVRDNYEMRGALSSGRITLQVQRGSGGGGNSAGRRDLEHDVRRESPRRMGGRGLRRGLRRRALGRQRARPAGFATRFGGRGSDRPPVLPHPAPAQRRPDRIG